ncbi:hypothetical protein C8R44DRAFT_880169 [Mycena epipterygia]|nr:hypothetical protein C8R44DRAFT_880169 [Mycena epipterygia]
MPANIFDNPSSVYNFRPVSTGLLMDPQPQIPNVPTAHAIRPLLPPPPPVVLPALLTDIFIDSFPRPVALTPLKPTRARIATRARIPTRARTPARARTPTRARALSSPLTTPETTPEPYCAEQSSKPIKRPSSANISDVKSIFARLYPNMEVEKQDAQYARFRSRLDQLTSIHLDSSLALSHQDEDCLKIVSEELAKNFPWLARCSGTWPVTVCLQSKLHNSAARNFEKNTRKMITSIKGLGKT